MEEILQQVIDTVDGRNPKQPSGMHKPLQILGYSLYQLVYFSHQQ